MKKVVLTGSEVVELSDFTEEKIAELDEMLVSLFALLGDNDDENAYAIWKAAQITGEYLKEIRKSNSVQKQKAV